MEARHPSSFKRVALRLVALGLGIACAFLIAEVAVRLFVPERLWAFWDSTTTWQLDSEIGWVQKPNMNLVRRQINGSTIHIQTNADGVSPATVVRKKTPGVIRILVLGDSAVAGSGVDASERIDAVLQRQLRDAGSDAEVINAGVNGYSTDQELLLLERLVPLYNPDVVLICVDQNDFGANTSRKQYGIPKPMFNLTSDGRVEDIPPDMRGAAIHNFAGGPLRLFIVHSALYRLLQPQIWAVRAHFLSLEQRNVVGLADELYYRPDALRRLNWPLFQVMLREMDQFSRAHGAELLVYLHPAVDEVWEPNILYTEKRLGISPEQYDPHSIEREVMRASQREGIPFCPLIDYFVAREQKGPFHLLPRDPHCNATGYRVTAAALWGCLQAERFLEKSNSTLRNASASLGIREHP